MWPMSRKDKITEGEVRTRITPTDYLYHDLHVSHDSKHKPLSVVSILKVTCKLNQKMLLKKTKDAASCSSAQ